METKLKGEGEVRLVRRTLTRAECARCGEPAVYRWTWLLPNFRSNPASKAYGRDDATWCADAEEFGCETCGAPEPRPNMGDRPGRFALLNSKGESNGIDHMFLSWREEIVSQIT